jgi:hypothetical protein
MLKNIPIKPHTLTRQILNKLKKMQKNLKNDYGLHPLAENLSKKNQKPGESIMRNFPSKFPT